MIERTLMVVEGGLFSSWAERLAREYSRVLLFRPWTRTFSHPNDFRIGTGYDSFERVEHFWEHIDEVDTFCFLDIHFPDWAEDLKKRGKAVWSAFYGEELELYRAETKQLLEKIGLPVSPYQVMEGMDALRDHLERHDEQYVKISKLRGLTETFFAENYDLIKPKLDEIEQKLGGAAINQEFICEDKVESVSEEGYDGWTIDGQFPQSSLLGIEVKDAGSASKVIDYDNLPEEVRATNDALSETLLQYGYRGFFSTEIRKTHDSFYPIDFTCRAASPCGENIQELCSNIGEIVEAGAHGGIVEPEWSDAYAVQAVLSSQFAEHNWLPVEIPDKIRSQFKLYHSCRIEGQEFVVPTGIDMAEIGSVVATGPTLEAAIKKCKQYADQIKGIQIEAKVDVLEKAGEELEKVS